MADIKSLGSYSIKNDRVYFQTKYDPTFVSLVKEIAGRKYNPENHQWDVPNNFTSCDQVKNIIAQFGLQNASDERSPESGILVSNSIEDVSNKLIPYIKKEIEGMNFKNGLSPREYQYYGIAYNLTAKRCIDGSDMGIGKTFTSIFTIEVGDLFPCLVVAPSSVQYNWKMQWNRVNPSRSVSIIDSVDSDFTADVLIMSYGGLGNKEIVKDKDDEEVEKIKLKFPTLEKIILKSIVHDESQNLKNGKTVRVKSIKKLTRKVEYLFMLSGTAIMNRPSELISPLTILRQFNNLFGSWMDFVYSYCNATETRFGIDISGASNLLELNAKLKQACYFRFEKRDVLKDLPEVEETILQVDIDNRKEYQNAKDDLVSYLKENYGELKANSALYAEQLVSIQTLSQLATKGKVSELCEWLDNFLESSTEKIVVAGIHVEHLKQLAKKYHCNFITGEVPPKKRQQIVDSFQVDTCRILFLNIMAGGVGIDGLQHVCNTMLVYEFPWRPTDLDQLIARIERDGAKNHILVYYMMGINTIDEDMWQILESKRVITDGVNKGLEVTQHSFMKELIGKLLK